MEENEESQIEMQSSVVDVPSGRSHSLVYDNRLKVRIVNSQGIPQAEVEYILTAGDEERLGVTDAEGWIRESGVRSDDVTIRLADGRVVYIPREEEQIDALDRRVAEGCEAEEETAETGEDEKDDYAKPDIHAGISEDETWWDGFEDDEEEISEGIDEQEEDYDNEEDDDWGEESEGLPG